MSAHLTRFRSVLIASAFLVFLEGCDAIACFKCQSKGGRDKACEQGLSSVGYEEDCRFRPVGRQSAFPGNYCVKVSGYLMPSREQIVIRDCDERPLKHHMMSSFKFHGMNINGTSYSCKTNYCNHSESFNYHWSVMSFLVPIFAYLIACYEQQL